MTAIYPTHVKEPMLGVVYAPASDLERYVKAGVLTQETLPQAFRSAFATYARSVALRGPDGLVTYEQLDAISERLGAAFIRMGLKPLDRVIFQIGNCNELIFGFFACLKAGLIPVCTLAAHRESEIGYLGNHAAARMHLVQGDDSKFDDVAFADRIHAGAVQGDLPA